jgi:putative copper resistance protein D
MTPTKKPGRTTTVRTQAVAWAVLLTAAVLALAWAYTYGGGAETGILDKAGQAVVWGVAAAKLVSTLASACTIGTLMLAVFALPHGGTSYTAALRFSGRAAAVWAGSAALYTYANFLLIANTTPSAGLGEAFRTYLTQVDAGRAGSITALIAVAVSVSCFYLQNPRIVVCTAAAAFTGLLPLILKSHAAGGADHEDSTTAVFVHAATAAVWLGGLVALLVLRRTLGGSQFSVTVRRYSTLALISFIGLAGSGFLAALARLGTAEALLSPYGVIVLAKTGVFVALGLAGALHRRWVLIQLEKNADRGGRHFAALAVVELAIMGAASGLAVALGRTEPPQPATSGGPDAALPGPDLWALVSQWELDPVWSLLCGFAVFAYLAGVHRLRAAGTQWPLVRTVLWLAGTSLLFVVTNGGVHVYQGYLFSAHVLTQMMLTAVVPLLLVPASPLNLARLAVKARTDGSTGVNEFIARGLQPLMAALGRDPFLAVSVLAVTLFATYFTPLLEWAATGQAGYSAMTLLALLAGCLATGTLTGVKPGAAGGVIKQRLLAVAGFAALYAFCGWKLLEQSTVLESPWPTAVRRPWGPLPAFDSDLGGPIMWSLAALALAVTAAALIRHHGTRTQPRSHGAELSLELQSRTPETAATAQRTFP